jgi:hypothetical protein
MFRHVASKAGLVGFALVCGAALAACASSDDSAGSSPSGGGSSSNSAGTGSSTAGASNNTGGSFSSTGGASNNTGGSTSIAGATSSGAGASSGGASATGPFTCAGTMANCSSWTTFAQSTMNSWGTGMFTGGITTFGTTLKRDATTTDSIHVTGTVDGYGYGFGLYFSGCSDLSKYTGVSFKIKGTAGTPPAITFQVQTNADYPWEAAPMNKGGCTATDLTNPFGSCIAPSKSVTVPAAETTVSVLWADLGTGMPTATADPTQVLGIQWGFPWATGANYMFDVTVSDVTLTGGTGSTSCNGAGGSGAGGASAGGASAGGSAGASSAGAGGATAGSGGTGGA